MADQPRSNDAILLGGLWLNKSKAGDVFMSGRLGTGGKLLVFKNKRKSKDTDPDYYACLGRWEQTEGGPGSKREEVPF